MTEEGPAVDFGKFTSALRAHLRSIGTQDENPQLRKAIDTINTGFSISISLNAEVLSSFLDAFRQVRRDIDDWSRQAIVRVASKYCDQNEVRKEESKELEAFLVTPWADKYALRVGIGKALKSEAPDFRELLSDMAFNLREMGFQFHSTISQLLTKALHQVIPHVQEEIRTCPNHKREEWRALEVRMRRLIDEPDPESDHASSPPPVEPTQAKKSESAGGGQATHVSTPPPQVPNLDDFVGQAKVKAVLERVIGTARVMRARKEKGLSEVPMSFHMVFAGNPGTGKTTIARTYGAQLASLGICKTGHVVEVARADLVAGYMGQTAIRTRECIESARGGILFIDEAYSLLSEGDDSYGKESIETLLKLMEDYRDELIVIAAGYSNLMRDFVSSNPGLESRFAHWVEFEDYSDEELASIFDALCIRHGMNVPFEARSSALRAVYSARRGRTFANAREVRRVFERGIQNLGARFSKAPQAADAKALTTLLPEDFDAPESSSIAANGKLKALPSDPLARLQDLVGLSEAKAAIKSLTDWLRVTKARKGTISLPELNLHMAFLGKPGTGKTTVARLVGEILRQLELLPSGHVVEVDRSGLVAEYLGQTAQKTREACERAFGGVLSSALARIDPAPLTRSDPGSRQEALCVTHASTPI